MRNKRRSRNSRGSSSNPDRQEDIKDFQDELKNKDMSKSNFEEVFSEYKSLRNSVNTGLSRLYEDLSNLRENLDEAEDQEEYRDRGFIREKTFEIQEDIIEIDGRIISWLVNDRQTQWILIQKQQELLQRMSGEQASREALEQLKEVFDEKFDADKEKMDIVKNTIKEYREQQGEKLQKDIQSLQERQDMMQHQFVETYNSQVRTMNQTIRELKDVAEISSENIQELEEIQQIDKPEEALDSSPEKIDQGFQKELDQKIDDIEDSEPEMQDVDTEQPSQSTGEEEPVDAPEPSRSGNEIEVPKSWNIEGSDTRVITELPENPRYGYTEEIRPIDHPETIMKREWMLLHSLDAGCETKDEIQDYCNNHFNGFPNSQVRKLVQNDFIEKEELPEKVQEMV